MVALLLLLLFTTSFAESVTYVLTSNGATSYTFSSPIAGDNPTIVAAPGDVLTFQVTGLFNGVHIFSVHTGTGTGPNTQFSETNRVTSTPVALSVDGSMTLSIGGDVPLGTVFWYVCEIHGGMKGKILIQCPAGSFYNGQQCTKCLGCDAGKFLSKSCSGTGTSDDHACSACNSIPNCLDGKTTCEGTADGTLHCTQCNEGFFINPNKQCAECAGCVAPQVLTTKCPGTSLTDVHQCGDCVLPENCFQGTCGGDCTECKDFYFLSAGKCSHCGDAPNCVPGKSLCSFSADSDLACGVCLPGFFINLDSACIECAKCEVDQFIKDVCPGTGSEDTHTCAACETCDSPTVITSVHCPGTTTTDTHVCGACEAPLLNCLEGTCASGICTKCKPGYFINNGHCSECAKCAVDQFITGGCSGLGTTDDHTCQGCGSCVAPSTVVIHCPGTGTTDTHTCSGDCILPSNCVQGTCGGACTSCKDRFYLSDGGCFECGTVTNCVAGKSVCTGPTATTGLKCLACNPGFFINNGQCSECGKCAVDQYIKESCGGLATVDNHVCQDCAACVAPNVISVHCPGTEKTDTHTCVAGGCTLPLNCLQGTCGGACTQCKDRFFVTDGGQCSECGQVTNCAAGKSTCTSATALRCTNCLPGYFINTNGQCVECTKSCGIDKYIKEGCSGLGTTDAVCQSCAACVAPLVISVHCPGTGTTDTHSCTQAGGCTLPLHCTKGTCGGGCTTCEDRFYLTDGGQCAECTPAPNCLPVSTTCTGPNNAGRKCSKCLPGYFIKDTEGGCVQCPGCTEGQFLSAVCTGLSTTDTHVCSNCAACVAPKVLASRCPGTGTTDTHTCADCTLPLHCKTGSCTTTPALCAVCEDRFYLTDGGQCAECTGVTNCAPLHTTCTGANNVGQKCSQCSVGFFINPLGGCSACAACVAPTTLKTPCPGTSTTDVRVCSDPPVTTTCNKGFVLREGVCRRVNCLLVGCGFSVLNIACSEVSETTFKCQCPNRDPVTVAVATGFVGCPTTDAPPKVEEIIKAIAADHVAAVVTNNVPEIFDITIENRVQNSIRVVVSSTTNFSQLIEQFKKALATLFDVDPASVHVKIEARKRANFETTVTATVDEQDVSSADHLVGSAFVWVFASVYLLASFLF